MVTGWADRGRLVLLPHYGSADLFTIDRVRWKCGRGCAAGER